MIDYWWCGVWVCWDVGFAFRGIGSWSWFGGVLPGGWCFLDVWLGVVFVAGLRLWVYCLVLERGLV